MKNQKQVPMIFKALILILICLYFTACGHPNSERVEYPKAFEKIIKGDVITGAAGELAPIVFNNELFYFSFGRESVSLASAFVKIQKFGTLETVDTFPFPYGYASVIVENGVIHIFASSESLPGNSIVTITSSDMINWSAPQVIYTAESNQTIYNTSPTKTDSGFALSFEVHEENYRTWWYQEFLSSSDLITWNKTGGRYDKTNSEACPMFRYVDGYFYVFTTGNNDAPNGPRYTTHVARSTDLVNFEVSDKIVLASPLDGSEGNNNSDLDSIEFNGTLYIVYGVGDQVNWGAMKSGHYNGTLKQFVNEFF